MGIRWKPFLAIGVAALVLASCAEGTGNGDGLVEPDPTIAAFDPTSETLVEERALGEPEEQAVEAQRKPEIFKGTGRFFNRQAASRPPVQVTKRGDVILNFAGANIGEVVRSILGNTLKVNYVLHPQVQGRVTVQTSRPLPRSALLPTLEQILRFNGAALVQSEGVYKILPLDQATAGAVRPRVASPERLPQQGFGVEIVPLRFVAAGEMEKILKPFAPAKSILRVDAARNLLMLSGTRRELENLVDIVEIFDVDWLSGMSIALFPVQFTEAKVLIADLEKVFGDQTNGPLAGVVRFVPIERLNAVLVLSPQPSYLETAKSWVERLDKGAETGEQRLHVYRVQNGRAAELAEVLSKIFSPRSAAEAAVPRLAPGRTPTEISTGGSAPTGTAQQGQTRTTQQTPAATRTAAGRTSGATPTRRATAARTAGRQPGRAGGEAGDIGLVGDEDIRIFADETKNALVVLSTPRAYRMIAAAIKRLDVPPMQVLIEATIAEVTLSDELKYGLQWFFQTGDNSFTLSSLASGAVSSVFPGFSYVLNGGGAQVVLNALSSLTDLNVISSPQLMVLDNQTATLQVGFEVPVSTQQAVGTADPDAPLVSTIQFRDTGVILKVTPRVNAGGLVMMDIEQEVSNVSTASAEGTLTPTIRQRKIQSTVAIQSGQTVALGGLIQESKDRSNSGLPYLSNIPVLGALFGSKERRSDRTELLVMITPRIVRNHAEARKVTEELRRRVRAVEPLLRKVK